MTFKLIISRYSEDVSWINDYDFDYIIFNKGPELFGFNTKSVENVGENQKDIFSFITTNYEMLPDVMAFVQGHPYDHCKKETFDKLITNKTLTRLEDYTHTNGSNLESDGLYFERNDSWYIHAHNSSHNQTCQFPSFDSFMNSVFENYSHIDRIPFSPGSQILFEKERALFYPKKFWEHLNNILIRRTMTEGHILERAMFLILSNIYTVKEEFR